MPVTPNSALWKSLSKTPKFLEKFAPTLGESRRARLQPLEKPTGVFSNLERGWRLVPERPVAPDVATPAVREPGHIANALPLEIFAVLGFPRSVLEFQRRSPDEAARTACLAATRWPEGFDCPESGHAKARQLDSKAWTYECSKWHRQTSVTAGAVMHGSKLLLPVWFWGAYLMATHTNGISAPQLRTSACAGFVQIGLAAGGETAPGRSRPEWLATGRPGRSRRDGDCLPLQEWIFYVLRGSVPWRMLPEYFPPHQTDDISLVHALSRPRNLEKPKSSVGDA